MKTRLLLVRHGATPMTMEDKFSGAENVHLSDQGREQAARLAGRLESVKIAAIYTSSLDRALETAEILGKPHGLQPRLTANLREISHGHWEGLTVDEVKARFGAELSDWDADPLTFAPSGGETGVAVLARVLPEIRGIVVHQPGRTVLIVSHKGALRLAVSSLLGLDPRAYRDRLDLSPASLSIVDFTDPSHAQLVLYNDISHYESGA